MQLHWSHDVSRHLCFTVLNHIDKRSLDRIFPVISEARIVTGAPFRMIKALSQLAKNASFTAIFARSCSQLDSASAKYMLRTQLLLFFWKFCLHIIILSRCSHRLPTQRF